MKACGTNPAGGVDRGCPAQDKDPDLHLSVGAGEGNRTLMTSLEGWGSTIELRPRGRAAML
jgi:hypothetical protein